MIQVVRFGLWQIHRGKKLPASRLVRLTEELCSHYERLKKQGMKEYRYMEQLEEDAACLYDGLEELRMAGESEAYACACERMYEMAGKAIESPYVPLFLLIVYRWAGAQLMRGNAEEALELYKTLSLRIEGMIGSDNAYYVRAVDKQAEALLETGNIAGALATYKDAWRRAIMIWGMDAPLTQMEKRHYIKTKNYEKFS